MLLLGFATLLAFAVRLAVIAKVYPLFLVPDQDHWVFGYEMGHVAYSIATGHGFANPYWGPIGFTVKVPPIYAYLMAGAFKVFGIYTKSAAIFILGLGGLFSALTCIPIFYIAKELAGIRTARWAPWLWVAFPPALYFSADRMWYFSLGALLICLLLWFTFRLGRSTSIWEWAGFGALAGFATLTNPVTLAILPFVIAWACYELRKAGKQWRVQASTCVFLFVAALSPWLIRNYEVFHKPVFVRDDFWLEFYVGNVGNWAYRWNGSLHPSMNANELDEYIHSGELAYMAHKKQQALAYVEANPGTFVWRSVRRFTYVWTGFWSMRSDYSSAWIGRTLILCYLGFTLFAIAGLRKVYRHDPSKAVLIALVLLFFPAVYYITHIEMGYRHPMDPILGVLAVYALVGEPVTATEETRNEVALGLETLETE